MALLSFYGFRSYFPSDSFTGDNKPAKEALGSILNDYSKSSVERNRVLNLAIAAAKVDLKITERTAGNFCAGTAGAEFYWVYYFWLHQDAPETIGLQGIDEMLLNGSSLSIEIEREHARQTSITMENSEIEVKGSAISLDGVPTVNNTSESMHGVLPNNDSPSTERHSTENDKSRLANISFTAQSQPPLFLPPPMYLDDEKSNWLSPAVENALPFVGRMEELRQLKHFAEDPGNFLVWGLSGPSGAGKTRLITKWMREFSESQRKLGEEWNIGFLDQSAKHLWKGNWETWVPAKPTFIAIDYIYKSQEVIAELFHRWRPPFDGDLPFKVRLLLVDHILPDDLEELNKHTWLKSITTGGTDWANKKKLFFLTKPLQLPQQAHGRNELAEIMQSAAKIFGKQLNEAETNAGIKVLRNSTMTWCPLFAALKGYAIATGAKSEFGDRRDLITHYLDTTNRLPWKEEDQATAARGVVSACFVAVATLLRDVAFKTLIDTLPTERISGQNFRHEINDIITRSCWIVSRNDPKVLHAFEPDIIGESFFLEFYQHIKYPIDESDFLIKALCKASSGDNSYAKTSEFIGFFERITRNLENDNQSDPKIILYWSSFLDFLVHNEFPENTPIRQAVSIALADVIQALLICGHSELASECLPE